MDAARADRRSGVYQALAVSLRVAIQGSAALKALFGSSALALDQAIYGLLLVVFIIYMPKGILGTGADWRRRLARTLRQ